jgi:1-acyl-sn-glycerol-3-phosphate acyltransferase
MMRKWLSYLWHEWWFWIAFAAMTLGFSFRMEGRRRIPRRGPLLIIANHQSFFDPIVLSLASPRRLLFLARKTLFEPPWFGWLLHSLGGVPMDQEGVAKEGLKSILHHLQAGEAVVVFPEGTRTADGELSPLKPGVQLLIKRTQPLIVPMGIAGAFDAMPYWRKIPTLSPLFLPAGKSTIAVWVGQPLDSHRFVDMPREQLVVELTTMLRIVKEQAERLRRKK